MHMYTHNTDTHISRNRFVHTSAHTPQSIPSPLTHTYSPVHTHTHNTHSFITSGMCVCNWLHDSCCVYVCAHLFNIMQPIHLSPCTCTHTCTHKHTHTNTHNTHTFTHRYIKCIMQPIPLYPCTYTHTHSPRVCVCTLLVCKNWLCDTHVCFVYVCACVCVCVCVCMGRGVLVA